MYYIVLIEAVIDSYSIVEVTYQRIFKKDTLVNKYKIDIIYNKYKMDIATTADELRLLLRTKEFNTKIRFKNAIFQNSGCIYYGCTWRNRTVYNLTYDDVNSKIFQIEINN